MEYYQGSLKQFAEELLAKGRGNGQILVVAQLDDNAAKSWGFVSEESLENPQFVLLK